MPRRLAIFMPQGRKLDYLLPRTRTERTVSLRAARERRIAARSISALCLIFPDTRIRDSRFSDVLRDFLDESWPLGKTAAERLHESFMALASFGAGGSLRLFRQ
jgi:hypothetical protein